MRSIGSRAVTRNADPQVGGQGRVVGLPPSRKSLDAQPIEPDAGRPAVDARELQHRGPRQDERDRQLDVAAGLADLAARQLASARHRAARGSLDAAPGERRRGEPVELEAHPEPVAPGVVTPERPAPHGVAGRPARVGVPGQAAARGRVGSLVELVAQFLYLEGRRRVRSVGEGDGDGIDRHPPRAVPLDPVLDRRRRLQRRTRAPTSPSTSPPARRSSRAPSARRPPSAVTCSSTRLPPPPQPEDRAIGAGRQEPVGTVDRGSRAGPVRRGPGPRGRWTPRRRRRSRPSRAGATRPPSRSRAGSGARRGGRDRGARGRGRPTGRRRPRAPGPARDTASAGGRRG